jgi:hypothetical protein
MDVHPFSCEAKCHYVKKNSETSDVQKQLADCLQALLNKQ